MTINKYSAYFLHCFAIGESTLNRGKERKSNNGELQKHREELVKYPSLIPLKMRES